MTKYLISFPSAAMKVAPEDLPAVGDAARIVRDDARRVRPRAVRIDRQRPELRGNRAARRSRRRLAIGIGIGKGNELAAVRAKTKRDLLQAACQLHKFPPPQ